MGLLCFRFYKTLQTKKEQSNALISLQQFSLTATQGNLVTQDDMEKAKWTVFVFFNSECHYCQSEANQLAQLKNVMKNIQFYWISSEEINRIKDFQENYSLIDSSNIFFFQDKNGQLTANWNITTTPQFLVYNAEGILLKNHKGAWRMDNLLETIQHGFKEN